MKNFRFQNIFYVFLIILFVGCEESVDTEQSPDSFYGYWINPQTIDSLLTFSKSNDLEDNNYGIAFRSDGTLIERKNSGWCATPPISYSDFEGSWNKTDSLISIVVDYWGGIASYEWKIIYIDDDKLVVYKIKEEYNYVSGRLKNLTSLDGCGGTDLGSYCMVGVLIEIDEIIDVTKLSCDQDVIISSEEYENAPNDSFSITELTITGDCLNIKFSASGCDGNTWIVKLIDSGNVAESYPCQRTLRLSLDNKEICTAVPGKEISFDIKDLQIVGNNKVILHVSGEEILYEY